MDLETDDILRMLSHADSGLGALSRRRFLQMAALGTGALAAYQLLPGAVGDAWAMTPVRPTDGILVLINLAGGNDPFNTVVPYASGSYYDHRRSVSIAPSAVLDIDGQVGFHPSLAWLHEQYRNGYVAIVEGVGYPTPDLSHFTSTALWMQGLAGSAPATTGWLGRFLDGAGAGTFGGLAVGSSIPLVLVGASAQGTGVPTSAGEFGVSNDPNDALLYRSLASYSATATPLGYWASQLAAATTEMLEVNRTVAPIYSHSLPRSPLPKQLALAARLINADLGTRVLTVSLGGFDTHADELGRHADLLAALDSGLRGFFYELDPRFADQVAVLVHTEFGRPLTSNSSGGTDHGTAGVSFLVGAQVRGGRHGQPLLSSPVDRYGQVVASVDYRSVFSTMLDRWLGADAVQVVGGSFAHLDLFAAAPGAPIAGPGLGSTGMPLTAAGLGFVPISPRRLLDTREGIGAPAAPLGPTGVVALQVAGRGGVPGSGVGAVLLNVTVTEPTASGFLTVWPTGADLPVASNLNFVRGQTVPNLVVATLGSDGQTAIFNSAGSTHVIADVVGYFRADEGSGLVPLPPLRLLDTRDGTGDIGGAFEAQEGRRLAVAGRVGVPSDGATAVVMNVTVTEPTASGFVTVHPAGEALPTASNLNFVRNLTVPNLVVSKLKGGAVEIYNSAGSTHIVADVVGYFTGDGGSALAPMTPHRLLDTRQGLGLAGPLVAGESGQLTVTGVADVPATARAVALNVTVTEPTAAGFVTVWPGGQERPAVSNLNFAPRQTVPNLVVCAVGPDGSVCVYNSAGVSHLVADVVAWFG